MRTILYVTGSRADYGLMRKTLSAIQNHHDLTLEIAVTGMHLMKEQGNTSKEIKQDGFSMHICNATFRSDDRNASLLFISQFTYELTALCIDLKPDIILLLGDRPEMLVGATVGQYMGIPVAHIHGGDVSSNVDDSVRHAITKLSNIHFAATEDAKQRIIKLGEDERFVYVVGAPGVEGITKNVTSRNNIEKELNINLDEQFILFLLHPEDLAISNQKKLAKESIKGTKAAGLQIIALYPNADAGSEDIKKSLEEAKDKQFLIYKHVPRAIFLGLMKETTVLVGNSSSGIIEAASFGTAVINICNRQNKRFKGKNVIDVPAESTVITNALKQVIQQNKQINIKNPYEQENTSEIIAETLVDIDIEHKELVRKQITY